MRDFIDSLLIIIVFIAIGVSINEFEKVLESKKLLNRIEKNNGSLKIIQGYEVQK